MRFFEYEAREVVKRAGIPVTDYGFTTDAAEAKQIAERIGGPTVIKSQVLTGGRMKAGGVKFADTPEEAEEYARDILALEINGHMPRGVLVDPKAEVAQEYYAGVVWDGTRKQPVMIFSPVGGIDIEQVAEEQPDKVGPQALLEHPAAQRLRGQGGDRLHRRHRLGPQQARADRHAAGEAVRRQRHDARRDQSARAARRRLVRGARRPHGHRERGARPPQEAADGPRRGRRGDSPGARGDAVRARRRAGRRAGPPRRGRQRDRVRRQPRARDRRRRRLAHPVRCRQGSRRQARQLLRDRRQPVGREGMRAGEARAAEARRGQDRGDDVDRVEHARGHRRARRHQGVHRAGHGPGREDRDLPYPGRVGGGGLQDPREVRRRLRRPPRLAERGRPPRGREDTKGSRPA